MAGILRQAWFSPAMSTTPEHGVAAREAVAGTIVFALAATVQGAFRGSQAVAGVLLDDLGNRRKHTDQFDCWFSRFGQDDRDHQADRQTSCR